MRNFSLPSQGRCIHFLAWLPALLVMLVFFIVSHQEGTEIHLPAFWNSDKLLHFFAYTVLGLCLGAIPTIEYFLSKWIKPALYKACANPSSHLSPIKQQDPSRQNQTEKIQSKKIKGLIRLSAGILYGGFDEIHQSYIPYRTAGLGDFTADALGVIFGYWIAQSLNKRFLVSALD